MSFCKNCGSEANIKLNAQDLNRKISEETFEYLCCKKCGFIFLQNIPTNLGDYYPTDYYGPVPKSANQLLGAAKSVENYKIDLVKKYCDGISTVLEIGPSMGGFALLCKDAGLDIRTLEMSQKCSDFLNNVAGIPTVNTSNELESLAHEKKSDLIALWHVIEHVVDPFALIEACAEKVNSGGFLLLAAPNPEALQFLIFKEAWVHLDAPRHTSLIPLKLLESKLTALGFEIVLSTTNDKGSTGWTEFGWEYSTNHIQTQSSKDWLSHVKKLTSPLEEVEGVGAAYTVISRKRT